MSKKRGKKKLALKRETLRKLDSSELAKANGGYIYKTKYCAGDTQAGASGGCTDTFIQQYDGSAVIKIG